MAYGPITSDERKANERGRRTFKHALPAPPEPTFGIDPELGRIAIGLRLAALFRLWALARHLARENGGWVARQDLYAQLKPHDIRYTRRHYNRLLKQGTGLFWTLGRDRLYLTGYVRLAERLTRRAIDQGRRELVDTNPPGVRNIHILFSGDHEQFQARVYAAWLTHRECPTISRVALEQLFGRGADTLQRWERLTGIIVQTNYAQSAVNPQDDDRILDHAPEHAYNYVDKDGHTRLRWQLPNTYKTPWKYRQHNAKGQSRDARRQAMMLIIYGDTSQPVENYARSTKVEYDRSRREVRIYFDSVNLLQRWRNRFEDVIGYVWRGQDRRANGIFELCLDGQLMTYAKERAPIRQEKAILAR